MDKKPLWEAVKHALRLTFFAIISYIKRKPIWEAVKHTLRLTLFTIISYNTSYMIQEVSGMPQTTVTVIFTLILTTFDKWLHQMRKQLKQYPEGEPLGLTPF
ncbi:MAG: hypothetical protein AABY22_03480 [Nanoarchaeota archaeon]